jgi:LPXTG-motif cell wall-anchored protein
MLTGINLVLLGIAFVTLAFWLLRRRARIEHTSRSLNQESTPRVNACYRRSVRT